MDNCNRNKLKWQNYLLSKSISTISVSILIRSSMYSCHNQYMTKLGQAGSCSVKHARKTNTDWVDSHVCPHCGRCTGVAGWSWDPVSHAKIIQSKTAQQAKEPCLLTGSETWLASLSFQTKMYSGKSFSKLSERKTMNYGQTTLKKSIWSFRNAKLNTAIWKFQSNNWPWRRHHAKNVWS